jgi:hypothetical protein
LSIATNSATAFNIGGGGANGINGSIQSNGGATLGASGGSIVISNGGGGVTLAAFTNLSAAGSTAGGSAGSINLSASSALTLPSGTWSMNATAGGSGNFSGGQLTLQGGTLSLAGALSLNANAVAAGDGGLLSLTTTSGSSNLTVGTGNITFSATGGSSGSSMGNGGSVTVSAGGSLTVNTPSTSLLYNPLGNFGNGASLTLSAGSNLLVGAALAANASQTAGAAGNGGTIDLICNSSTVFNVASGAVTNGVNAAAPAISANGGASVGAGGTILIRNSGTGGITLGASNLSVAPVDGNGGSITLDTSNGTANASGNGIVTVPGAVTLNVNAVNAGNGGSYTIIGSSFTTSSANFVTLQANAAGFGNGGTVSVTASAGALVVNNAAVAGDLSVSATGGASGGNGGSVTLNALGGNNLSITTPGTNVNVAPTGSNGNGGNLTLSARNITISAALTVTNGIGFGTGGTVSITTNSATAFNVGAAGSNGIGGAINANAGNTFGNGGSVTINNTGGGITLAAIGNISTTTSAGGGIGGSLKLNASGTLTVPTGSISENAVANTNTSSNFQGGSINLAGATLVIGTGTQALTLSANGVGMGAGGSISLNSGSTAITVNSTNIQVSATGGSINSTSGDGGTVSLTTTGNLSITAGTAFNVGPSGLDGAGANLTLSGAAVAITGALSANGVGTGFGGNLSITSNSATAFSIGGGGTNGSTSTITANGGTGTLTTGVNGGMVSITNRTGGITLPAFSNISASSSYLGGAGGSISLTANSTSAVITLPNGTMSANATQNTAGTGNFAGGSLSISAGQISFSAGAALLLTANGVGTGAGGTVSVATTNTTAAGAVTVANASGGLIISAIGGSLTSPNGNVTISSGNALTLNLSAFQIGPSTLNANGGSITLSAGSAIVAANLKVSGGNLSANALGSGSAGSVSITYNDPTNPFVIGATVSASGVSGNITASAPGAGASGNVTISNLANSTLSITLTGSIITGSALTASGFGNIILNESAGNAINAAGAGALTGSVTATGTVVTLNPQAAGAALIAGNIATSSGALNVTTSGASSLVFIPITGTFSTTGGLTTVSTFGLTNYNSIINNSNQNISITTDFIDTRFGTVYAGSANVSIVPNSNAVLITAGNGSKIAGLDLTQLDMSNITGSTLTIGSTARTGGFTVAGAIDVSGAGPAGVYNLVFNNGGNYTATGQTITLGTKTLTVTALGSANTGTVSGGSTTVSFTSTNLLTVDGTISISGAVTLSSTSNNVQINQNVNSTSGAINISSGVSSGNQAAVASSTTVTGGIITITTPGLVLNSGASVSSNQSGTAITVQSPASVALTLSGTETFTQTNVTAGTTFLASTTGINLTNSTNVVVNGGGTVLLQSPSVTTGVTGDGTGTLSANISASGPINVQANGSQNGTITFGKLSGAASGTLNLNGGPVTTTSASATVNSVTTLASNNILTMNVNGGTLTNSGTITSSASAASAPATGVVVTIQSNGALAVAGSGTYTLTGGASGGVVPVVQFSASGSNQLSFTGSNTFNLGPGGVNMEAQSTGGSVTFGSGTKQTMTSGLYMYVSSPTINFPTGTVLDESAATGSTIAIDSGGSSPVALVLPSGTVTLLSGSYGTTISPNANNQPLTISSAGTTTFNLNGGPAYFYTYAADQTIGSNVTVQSNNNIECDIIGSGNFNLNGSISATTPASSITVHAFGDASGSVLTMGGSPGTIGGGTQSIVVEADKTVTFTSSYSFNAGSAGTVSIGAENPGGTVNFNASTTTTATGNSLTTVFGQNINFGASAQVVGTRGSGGPAVSFSYIGGVQTVSLPNSSSATLSSSGGSLEFHASNGLTFGITGGSGSSTLNASGGAFGMYSDAGTETINSGVTLQSNKNIIVQPINGTLTDNGTITTSAAGGTISIQGGLTLNGTPQPITVTGGGSAAISVTGYGGLNINSSYTFNPGASGSVALVASPGSGISLAGGATLSVAGGGPLNITTQTLTMGNGSIVSVAKSSGQGINIGVPPTTGLAISAPAGATATFQTTGASINIGPTSPPQALSFSQVSSGATTTIALNGGPASVTTAIGAINVNSGISLSSNNTLTLSSSNGSIVNAGTITGTAASGSTATSLNAVTIINTGSVTGSSGANIQLSDSSGDLTVSGASGTITAVGSGAVSIMAAGNVSATQQQITGTLKGTAGKGYAISTANGNLTVGNITAGQGNLSITSGTTASGTANTLTVAAGATVLAHEGNTTVENADVSKGSILIGNSAIVEAYTATTNTSLGNVNIVIGAVPGSPTNLDPSQRPSNVLVNVVGTGKIYWGTSNTSGQSIVANAPTNTINSFNRTVIFNVGSTRLPSAITLNGAVTVVADPPAPGAVIIYATSLIPPEEAAPPVLFPILQATSPIDAAIVPTDVLYGTAIRRFDGGNSIIATDVLFKEQTDSGNGELLTDDDAQVEQETEDEVFPNHQADQSKQNSDLTPIAFTVPEAAPGQNRILVLHTLETEEGVIKHTGRTQVSHEGKGVLNLRSGEMLVAASSQLAIKCGRVKVSIAKGAYVLISRRAKVMKVKDLTERSMGSVRVYAGDKSFNLKAGQEIILSGSDKTLTEIASRDGIGRRRVKSVQLAAGAKMLLGEFSLVSMMRRDGLLFTMLHSQNDRDKEIARKLIKTAACLMYATGSHGSYSTKL